MAANLVQTIDVLVGLGVESAGEKLARSEAVIRSQRRLGLKLEPPTRKFSDVCKYALVEYGLSEYGVVKPRRLLDLVGDKLVVRGDRRPER